MQWPQLTLKKTVIIIVLLNVVIYKILNPEGPFKIVYKNLENDTDIETDKFHERKSLELKNKILEESRLNFSSKLLKQKYFTSNLAIYTLKTTDTSVYIDELNYSKSKKFSLDNDIVKHIINNPKLNPKNIKIYNAPVRIELIKEEVSSTIMNPAFKAILNNSATILLSYENLLYLTEKKEFQKNGMDYLTYPAKLILCPRGSMDNKPRANKAESLARMENVINLAPFMKKIIDMERFRSKSNKPNIRLCFWLKFSSYEEYIKSDMYLTAFAPEYAWIRAQ